MRQWIDLVESRMARATDDRFSTRKELLDAILAHIRQQIDSDMTRQEFISDYRELLRNLKFPMKVYRAMSAHHGAAPFDFSYNAHHDDFDEYHGDLTDEKEALTGWLKQINFKSVGCYWTFDRSAAVAGGELHSMGDKDANVILEATVTAPQVDLPMTLYQNLTVYQEEKEVRLLANIPIKITGIHPNPGLFKLPIRANTGPESWDSRESSFRDLENARRR